MMDKVLPLEIHLKRGAHTSLFSSGEINWENVDHVKANGESAAKWKLGQVAVVYAHGTTRMMPVATGFMDRDCAGDEDHLKPQERFITICHHLFDKLWNLGDCKIPPKKL